MTTTAQDALMRAQGEVLDALNARVPQTLTLMEAAKAAKSLTNAYNSLASAHRVLIHGTTLKPEGR